MDRMQKTTVYLPVALHRELKALAKRTRQPQADLIREAVRRLLQDQDGPPLRSLGVARSREIAGRTAEDWLREHWRPG